VTGHAAAPGGYAKKRPLCCVPCGEFVENNLCPNWGAVCESDVRSAERIFQTVLNKARRIGHLYGFRIGARVWVQFERS